MQVFDRQILSQVTLPTTDKTLPIPEKRPKWTEGKGSGQKVGEYSLGSSLLLFLNNLGIEPPKSVTKLFQALLVLLGRVAQRVSKSRLMQVILLGLLCLYGVLVVKVISFLRNRKGGLKTCLDFARQLMQKP